MAGPSREIQPPSPPLDAGARLDGLARPVQEAVHLGQFRVALEHFASQAVRDALEAWRKKDRTDPRTLEAAAILAELHSYLGRSAVARDILRDFADSKERDHFLRMQGASAHARLQISEAIYSRGDYDEAIAAARMVLRDINPTPAKLATEIERWSVGLACYYLARYHARRGTMSDSALYCARALEAYSSTAESTNLPRPWRIGQVFVVQGFADWRTGQLVIARARLHVALALLQSSGDFISIANAEQSLGCVLRSQGEYAKAADAFNRAAALYEGSDEERERIQNRKHVLNYCRVMVYLGRTALATGSFEESSAKIDEALKTAKSHWQEHQDSIWGRQYAEACIWRARLLRQAPAPLHDLERATASAKIGLNIARNAHSRSNQVEALLVLGQCSLDAGEAQAALEHVQEAKKIATDTGIVKLTVSARLLLAEILAAAPLLDFKAAEDEWRDASTIIERAEGGLTSLGDRPEPETLQDVGNVSRFSQFLRIKANEVRSKLDSAALVVSSDQIAIGDSGLTLEEIVSRARGWAFDAASRKFGGNAGLMADALNVSRQAVYNWKSAHGDASNDAAQKQVGSTKAPAALRPRRPSGVG
jgi:tetratricopeptide (TPR) repeat protein